MKDIGFILSGIKNHVILCMVGYYGIEELQSGV
jgi:hypothetical protein